MRLCIKHSVCDQGMCMHDDGVECKAMRVCIFEKVRDKLSDVGCAMWRYTVAYRRRNSQKEVQSRFYENTYRKTSTLTPISCHDAADGANRTQAGAAP